MQNKHPNKILDVGVPMFGEGGGQAGWDKIPSLSKEINFWLPLGDSMNIYYIL